MKLIIFNKDSELLSVFQNFPISLYKGDKSSYLYQSDISNSYLLDHFLVLEDKQVKARASVFYNKGIIIKQKTPYQIGNYECIDNDEIAKFLLQGIEEYIQAKGGQLLLGPMKGSTLDEYRFNAQDELMFGEKYHHLYYLDQWKKFGFETHASYYSSIDDSSHKIFEQEDSLNQKFEQLGYKIRCIDLDKLEKELQILYPFVIHSFSRNYLFTPFSEEEFLDKYLPLKAYLNPEIFYVVENQDKEVIGFYLCLEDHYHPEERNIIVKSVARNPDPGYKGLGSYMANYIVKYRRENNYNKLIHAFIYDRGYSNKLSLDYNGKITKRYYLLEKQIGS